MALRKSTALLPEVFRTSKNAKFLNATLDQLISEPKDKRVNSYVGRKYAANYSEGDSYVSEFNDLRQNYQLEPAVVYRTPDQQLQHVSTHIDLIDSLKFNEVDVSNQDKLFEQEYYNWSSFIDLDKLINYGEYFWLPDGPDRVQVFGNLLDTQHDYTVLREETTYIPVPFDTKGYDNADGFDAETLKIATGNPFYRFDNATAQPNPVLYLARGGNYTFEIDQPGIPFWIQTEVGLTGISAAQDSLSTREILGVTNNGEDNGVISFNVPTVDAQNVFTSMPLHDTVDLATDLFFNDIHNSLYSDFIEKYGGIDKFTELDGKRFIFVNNTPDESKWETGGLFDDYGYDEDGHPLDETTVVPILDRYSIYEINLRYFDGFPGDAIIEVSTVNTFPQDVKVHVKQGQVYGNRQFYKDVENQIQIVPPTTALLDTLYYQDGIDADRFGRIELVDIGSIQLIDIERDILGKKAYTSPNGVVFENGLKVEFDSTVVQTQYRNNAYYVEGVSSDLGITLVPVTDLRTPETYIKNTSEGFDVKDFDEGGWDGTDNAPVNQDYIIANRSCIDNNAWARSNRWFHRSVINNTNKYNNFIPIIDDTARARRPIIEFIPNMQLFDHGKGSVPPVSVVDTTQTDAFSNINGYANSSSDRIILLVGMTVIFAADADEDVRNKVYRVDYIDEDADITTQRIINLVPIATIPDDTSVVSLLGHYSQGKTFYFKNNVWVEGQQKTKLNQEPLYDLFDGLHRSFSTDSVYNTSSFKGSKLFSYKRNNSGSADSVLGFGLTYGNFNNVGDIVFENNYISDKFTYNKLNQGLVNVITKSGHVHQYNRAGTSRTLLNGWTKVVSPSRQYQVVNYTVDKELYTFEIGAEPADILEVPTMVYVNSKFCDPAKWSLLEQNNRYYVVFETALKAGDYVTIRNYSTTVNRLGYYEIPKNLENNANNADFNTLTLGQVRNHLIEITRSIPNFTGEALGTNNLKDLDYKPYPGKILQHSAGMSLANFLLTSEYSFVEALDYAKNEYTRFKNNFIDNIEKLDLDLRDVVKCVDDIISHMVGAKTDSFPFFYSDMLAWGTQKVSTSIYVDDPFERRFEFQKQFDLTELSTRSVLIYHTRPRNNNAPVLDGYFEIGYGTSSEGFKKLLVEGEEYTFETTDSAFNLRSDFVLQEGDTFEVLEYDNTDGSFVPPTPSKLGMWPKYAPHIYEDITYETPQKVIVGHDGSKWIAYDDIRDEIILEFEKRVYNNIKTQYDEKLFDWSTVLAGYWRSPLSELSNEISLTRSALGSWGVKNKLNITENKTFDPHNPFSWNYKNCITKDKGTRTPGGWRGIFHWLYDTDTPHMTPWEMLGLSQKPEWWDKRYGVGPYTAGNSVLWEDLRDGKLYSGHFSDDPYVIKERYKRPGLLDFIPTNEQGELRSPRDFVFTETQVQLANEPWTFGDWGPVENAWRRSSEWPFAAQLIAAFKKPAQYFTRYFDTNLIDYVDGYSQYVQKGKSYRQTVSDYTIHGTVVNNVITRTEGISQLYYNYSLGKGFDPINIQYQIQNLNLNLAYKLSGFTDKKMLKVIAESVSPTSDNAGNFVPDEDFDVHLLKSQPLERVIYSAVKIIKREKGYEVQGYDDLRPFFRIIPSERGPDKGSLTVGSRVITIHNQYKKQIVEVPYGTVIKSVQQVVDFLVSYQRYLLSRGMQFNEIISGSGEPKNFVLSAQEFVFWTQQEWPVDSVFTASPCHDTLVVERTLTTTDDFSKGPTLIDANGQPIRPAYYDVERIDNKTSILVNNDQSVLYGAVLNPVQYEHCLVFKNVTIFNDVIYQPEIGSRQERMKLIGSKVADWNGTLHAPGFMISDDVFDLWQENKDYGRGDFVIHSNKLFTSKSDHGGTDTFQYANWIEVKDFRSGLLPNLSNKADRFKDFFNIDSLNLEDDTDKTGKSLIGFRNRSFLQNLGIDDVSQVKFYQGMLKGKGSPDIVNRLIKANLTNLDQSIDFYEEWGFRVGEYGSIDANQVLEVILDESKAQENPLVAEFIEANDLRSDNRIQFKETDLYQGPTLYNKNFLATRNSTTKNNDLDSAGFPRLDDVDFTLFDIDDYASLDISRIGRGDKVWIARDGNTWGVRRVTETNRLISVVDTTASGQTVYTLDARHNLQKGDIIGIESTEEWGGFHKILSIPSPVTFSVASDLELEDPLTISADNHVIVYRLETAYFNTLASSSSTTPQYGYDDKELLWIENDENSKWAVYQKQSPWNKVDAKSVDTLNGDAHLGTSLALSKNNLQAVVGAPDQNTGAVYPFLIDANRSFVPLTPLTDGDAGGTIDSLGYSVAAGDAYTVAGAPGTDSARGVCVIYKRQSNGTITFDSVLTHSTISTSVSGNLEFGYSVSMTPDDRYIFVGAPGYNSNAGRVYVFGKVDVDRTDEQRHNITGDGSTTAFAMSYTPTDTYSVVVKDSLDKFYIPGKDFTITGSTITFTSAPANGLLIVVDYRTHYRILDQLDGAAGSRYGSSVSSSLKGRELVVGAPNRTIDAIANAGEILIHSQVVEAYTGNGLQTTFTIQTSVGANTPIYIEVNGVEQVLADGAFGGYDSDSSANRYTRNGQDITFRYIPQSSDTIKVYTGTFGLIQRINQTDIAGEVVSDSELFGSSVSIDPTGAFIAIGCPGEDETNPNTGSVYILADEGLRYGKVTTKGLVNGTTSGSYIAFNDYLMEVSYTEPDPTLAAAKLKIDIDELNLPGVTVTTADDDSITVEITSVETDNKLRIRPVSGVTFGTGGVDFAPYQFTQKINHPALLENENFGEQVCFDRHQNQNGIVTHNLSVSSSVASTVSRTRLDLDTNTLSPTYNEETTTFDNGSTKFITKIPNSGAVYLYDFVAELNESTTNPPQLIYIQNLTSTDLSVNDNFGSAIYFQDDKLAVGAKLDDLITTNGGTWYEFVNAARDRGFKKLRAESDLVDVSLINSIRTYNKRTNSVINFIDYIDPYKGKIAGEAAAEIDYITAWNPAEFSESGAWNDEHIGEVWWDLSTCSVILYEQGELDYRARNWGTFFPGSTIDVYEWIESNLPPESYDGDGEVRDVNEYNSVVRYNPSTDTTSTFYYFWIKNSTEVNTNVESRNISVSNVRQLIEDPASTGQQFVNVVAQNALSLVNIKRDLSDKDLVLSINYDKVKNDNVVHSEFDLIAEGEARAAIPDRIWNKMVDSIAGADKLGQVVPNPALSEVEKYGIQTRPRQSLFRNRLEALRVLVQYCNKIFLDIPIIRQSDLTGLTDAADQPTVGSGLWDRKVNTATERDYLNTVILATGYRVLVDKDENYDNLWTVYRLAADKSWVLERIQSYDTTKFWEYATWYASGYTINTVPDYQVDTEPDLLTLIDATVGQVAKVLYNDDGNYSFFELQSNGQWVEKIIERGTIQLKSSLYDYSSAVFGSYIGFDNDVFDYNYFDKIPATEVRTIMNTIKDQILIDTNAIYFNQLFFRLVEYSLDETIGTGDWALKTSFIKVLHKIRDLDQYPTYKKDVADLIENFIEEVKPYHTKIREYVGTYTGLDTFGSDETDFDLHSFYDINLNFFRKPSGDYSGDEILRTQGENKPWSQNYTYYLDDVIIWDGGTGYVQDPTITVSAPDVPGGVQAKVVAYTNTDKIVRAQVTQKGSGYIKTPTITVTGSGTGLRLIPRIKNDQIREFDVTLKFDRITYSSTVKEWKPNTVYNYLDLIVYTDASKNQEVYQVIANGGHTSGATFTVENVQGATELHVYKDELLPSAADRIAAYYIPGTGMIGDDLKLLQDGTEYRGVKVQGSGFDQNPGFDLGGWDNVPFDDFDVDTDGLIVQSSLDSIISSTFNDLALGTRPEDINIDGGAFVDTYSSHAPEEVIPGIVFDTLDMEVYTGPSQDPEFDGNGIEIVTRAYNGDGSTYEFAYANTQRKSDVDLVTVWNGHTPVRDFVVDHNDRTVKLATPPAANDSIYIYGFGSSGEKMTSEATFVADGSTVSFTMSIDPAQNTQSLVMVNGVRKTRDIDYTWSQTEPGKMNIFFNFNMNNGDHIHIFTYSLPVGREAPTQAHVSEVTLTTGVNAYTFDRTVQYNYPYEGNVIVELNGLRLRPSNTKYHRVDGSSLVYATPNTAGETIASVSAGDVRVTHIDHANKTYQNMAINQDYTFSEIAVTTPLTTDSTEFTADEFDELADSTVTSANSFNGITLINGPLTEGDELIVSVLTDAEYQINGDIITLGPTVSYNNGDKLYITSFANHDTIRMQTKVFEGLGTDINVTTFGFDDDVGFDADALGGFDSTVETGNDPARYTLDRTIVNRNYAWVTINGEKMHSGEFTIDDEGRLDLSSQVVDEFSIVVVSHFVENTIEPTVGFRIFKNMLGDFEYLRIAQDSSTLLERDLLPTHERVYVSDASKLSYSDPDSIHPGVIMVGSERITYWEINYAENYVTNIRRATGGTNFDPVHYKGEIVADAGLDQKLPANDTHTKIWYTQGSGTAANGLGIQQSNTLNAKFLRESEAQVPAYIKELDSNEFIVVNYLEDGYVEVRST